MKLEFIEKDYKGEPTLKRDVSKVIFYDKEGKILLQDRSTVSKNGEKWGLFGGGIEEGEDSKSALSRELREEIADLPENLNYKYFSDSHTIYLNKLNNRYRELFETTYTCKVPENLKINVLEGGGAKWFDLDSARKLKMIPGNYELIEIFLKHYMDNLKKG